MTKITATAEYISDEQVMIRLADPDRTKARLTLSPEEAGRLGAALITASAVCRGGPPKPKPGSKIEGGITLVTGWAVGRSKLGGDAVLALTIAPELQLTFQFASTSAKECGSELAKCGASAQRAQKDRLN